jgi:hypothetical protein
MPWVPEEQRRINQENPHPHPHPHPATSILNPSTSDGLQLRTRINTTTENKKNEDNQNGFYNKAKHNRTKKKQSNPNLIEQSEDVSNKALTLPTNTPPPPPLHG